MRYASNKAFQAPIQAFLAQIKAIQAFEELQGFFLYLNDSILSSSLTWKACISSLQVHLRGQYFQQKVPILSQVEARWSVLYF